MPVRRNVEPLKTHRDTFTVPPISIREYRHAVCLPFGIAIQDNLVLPETYRHNQYTRLKRKTLSSKSHFFTDVPPHEPSRRLEGPHFNLASEYPSHFGHFMSEVVSRLWGWAAAKQRHPSLKALISHPRKVPVPDFVYGVLAAYGIQYDEIEVYGPDETVERRHWSASPRCIRCRIMFTQTSPTCGPPSGAVWRRKQPFATFPNESSYSALQGLRVHATTSRR